MFPVLPSANTHHVHLDNNNTTQRSTSKRSSSMIFRIEHLLPTSNTAPNIKLEQTLARESATTSSSLHENREHPSATRDAALMRRKPLRSGVYVSQFTPKETVSESLETLPLISSNNGLEQHTYCTISQGLLCMTSTILRRIKLSEDIHSYNALFELHNERVRVRVARDIGRGEELVAWFDEETTMLMSIPFLTPLNIQGNNRYTCHLCHLTFETPNPLKIHLALGCGRHSLDILWIRLHYAIKASSYTQQQLLPPVPTTIAMQLPPTTRHSTLTTSSTTSILPATSQQAPPQRLSAFRPIPSSLSTSSSPSASSVHSAISMSIPPSIYTTTTVSASTSALSFLPSISSSTLPSFSLLQPPNTNPLNAAAQIEAIVSNMGASKQGHLCIYCGKVYSRKYGLKIHIRTHTGFKPLKCKFCLRPFGDPSNLNKHVRLHLQASTSTANTEGYKCHLCQKTLARRRDLQRHVESQHSIMETGSSH